MPTENTGKKNDSPGDHRIVAFLTLSEDDWLSWLDARLKGQPCGPAWLALPEEDVDLTVARLARLLPSDPLLRLSGAVAQLLQATRPYKAYEERLGILLSLSAALTPIGARQVLTNLVLSSILKTLSYRAVTLHSRALSALSMYEVSETLSDYILRDTTGTTDYRYLLQCFRILSDAEDDRHFILLDQLFELLSPATRSKQLAFHLRQVCEKGGYRSLYYWYIRNRKAKRSSSPGKLDLFENLLRDTVVPWGPSSATVERTPFKTLLSAELHADRQLFHPDRILSLMGIHLTQVF